MNNPASIEFVNHASFIIEAGGLSILNDPWLFGSAFNNGWDLLCDYRLPVERFASIDYIWFSHEHPDHFSPPVLKSIPEDIRRGITILFQETRDRKVVEFCRGLGFGTMELPDGKRVELNDRLAVTCGAVPWFDSWILYDTGDRRVLNINDCVVDGDGVAEDIHRITGDVDLLFTQFSYAAWKGNVDDRELRLESARSKLEIMADQIRVFRPAWTIPFASFVYFSHEENSYNNDGINHPEDAIRAIRETGSTPVLLYPGDRWTIGEEHDNRPALERYDRAYDLEEKVYHRTGDPIPFADLQKLADAYIERIGSKNSLWMIRLLSHLPVINTFRPLDIYLHDLDMVCTFSIREGLKPKESGGGYDVWMSTDSLAFIFRFDWGYDTLTVNGRFRSDMEGFSKMTKLFAVGPLNNTGRSISPRLLLDFSLIRRFLKALASFSRRLRRHQTGRA